MPHNIMLDKMFYGRREPAWHKLGITTDEDKTAQEVLGLLGGGYYVDKRPVTVFVNNENRETGDYALVRSAMPDDPQEFVFGYVTKGYNVLNPLDISILFDENVHAPVETLGFLGHGEKMFLTWKLPSTEVGKSGDLVDNYGFVACGYDGRFGASLYNTAVRVVCQNTFNAAVQIAESDQPKKSGRGSKIWTGTHTSEHIARDLGIWMEHIQTQALQKQAEMTNKFNAMSAFPIYDPKQVNDLLMQIYPDPAPIPVDFPIKLRGEKEDKRDELMEKAQRDRILVTNLFSEEGTEIEASAWGLFNSVTEYENWGRATRRPAEVSVMLGARNQVMQRAYGAITQFVEKSA